MAFIGPRERGTASASQSVSFCNCDNPVCSACGKLCQVSQNISFEESDNVTLANTVIMINDQPNGREDAVSQLTRLPSGPLLISKAKNVTLTQRHTEIIVDNHLKVKMHVATDQEEIVSVGDRVMIFKSEWDDAPSEAEESASSDNTHITVEQRKEILMTKFLTSHTNLLYNDVIQELQKENLPGEVLKTLFRRFHLRLLGITKRVEILMEVDATDLPGILKQGTEVHEVLSRLVSPDRQSALTWAEFSHFPVQCTEGERPAAEAVEKRPSDVVSPAADLPSMDPRRVFVSKASVSADEQRPFITAVISTEDNRLVIADRGNSMVKVLGLTQPYSVYAYAKLDHSPLRLALLKDGLVAATSDTNTIYLLSIGNRVVVESAFQTQLPYCGIVGNSTDDKLIVSCGQIGTRCTRVDLISRDGKVEKTLVDTDELISPQHLCLDNDQILVSDNSRNAVYRVNTSGQIVDTLEHEDMKRPSQLAVDSAGNVYVACFESQCVLVRSRSGVWRRLLYGPEHSETDYHYACGLCVTSRGVVVVWDQGVCDYTLIEYDRV